MVFNFYWRNPYWNTLFFVVGKWNYTESTLFKGSIGENYKNYMKANWDIRYINNSFIKYCFMNAPLESYWTKFKTLLTYTTVFMEVSVNILVS